MLELSRLDETTIWKIQHFEGLIPSAPLATQNIQISVAIDGTSSHKRDLGDLTTAPVPLSATVTATPLHSSYRDADTHVSNHRSHYLLLSLQFPCTQATGMRTHTLHIAPIDYKRDLGVPTTGPTICYCHCNSPALKLPGCGHTCRTLHLLTTSVT
ncbi:hypothetical protein J6590_011112 [Homalodisca vitripennis]|nr:hypothetical protein J6590_011112 [Homalodisca vitripennis]